MTTKEKRRIKRKIEIYTHELNKKMRIPNVKIQMNAVKEMMKTVMNFAKQNSRSFFLQREKILKLYLATCQNLKFLR